MPERSGRLIVCGRRLSDAHFGTIIHDYCGSVSPISVAQSRATQMALSERRIRYADQITYYLIPRKQKKEHPHPCSKTEYDPLRIAALIRSMYLEQAINKTWNNKYSGRQTYSRARIEKHPDQRAQYEPGIDHCAAPAQRKTESANMRCPVRTLIA